MEEKFLVAQQKISQGTEYTTLLIFLIISILLYNIVFLINKNSPYYYATKICVIIIIILILSSSYQNITNINSFLGHEKAQYKQYATIETQINYTYILNFTLSIFAIYIIYSVIF